MKANKPYKWKEKFLKCKTIKRRGGEIIPLEDLLKENKKYYEKKGS